RVRRSRRPRCARLAPPRRYHQHRDRRHGGWFGARQAVLHAGAQAGFLLAGHRDGSIRTRSTTTARVDGTRHGGRDRARTLALAPQGRTCSCQNPGNEMHHFTPFAALIGGVLIGLAAALFFFAHGRVCGISGLFGGLLRRGADVPWLRLTFIGGLLAGGLLLRVFYPAAFTASWSPSLMLAIPAGLLVGFGT